MSIDLNRFHRFVQNANVYYLIQLIYIYIYRYTYISEVGGVSPTGKSFRFVRSCVRCEAAYAPETMLLPRLGRGSSRNAPLGAVVARALRLSVGHLCVKSR